MILFLDLASQPQGRDQRELRARADGAVHARRRPRGLHRERRARARPLADRLGLRLERRAGRPQLPLGRAGPLGPGLQDRVRQDGRWTWEDAARMVVEHPKHPSFFVAKLWSYFVPTAPDAGTRGRARGALRQLRLRDPPGARGDPCSPQLYAGPRMVKPPTVFVAGMLRARKRGDHHQRVDLARSPAAARSSTTRPTSRAGTTSAGSTPTPRSGAGRRS